MLPSLALAGAVATLLSTTSAAPISAVEARQSIPVEGEPRQIRWLKTTPEGPGQAAPGEYCLQVSNPGFGSGSVDIGNCLNVGPGESTPLGPGDLQLFYYNLGATKIRVLNPDTGEVSCVDFGDNPTNGSPIRLASCVDNAPGQNLYITDDLHIAVENGPGQCLDVQAESGTRPTAPYGSVKDVQSYECSFGNENQIFIFSDIPGPTPPPTPVGEPRPIRWLKTTPESEGQAPPGEYCLQVTPPGFGSGSVDIGECGATPYPEYQNFYYNLGSTKIQAVDPTTNEVRCVDFGDNPSSGRAISLNPCVDNAPGQNLFITDDLHIAVENGPGQCMDVRAESGTLPRAPWPIVKQVQSWECSFGNENQIFIFSDTPTPPPPPRPVGEPRPIRWLKTTPESEGQAPPGEYCLQVGPPGFSSGSVDIGECGATPYPEYQNFYYNLGPTKIQAVDPQSGVIRCIDFSGQLISLNPCTDNAAGQNLFITDDLHIAVENGPGQCLDVRAESGIVPRSPYPLVKTVQSWECSFGNENQIFIFPNTGGFGLTPFV